jgi:hypothetical protein
VKIVGLCFRCGNRDGHHAGSLNGNGAILILQNAVHAKKLFVVDHAAIFFIKVGIHNPKPTQKLQI